MNFHILTIFPESIKNYSNSSILGRAQKNKIIKINLYNLRDFAEGNHRKTDDRSFGGGPGMVMKVEPIAKVIDLILETKNENKKIILFSPQGKIFNKNTAREWAKKYDNIIMICGRYEGVDERVRKIFKAEEVSVGPYILTGGELPAIIVADAVSRHVSGVLGKKESLEEKREESGCPVYTKPEIFEHKGKKYKVPKILLSGNHQKIKEWRTSVNSAKYKKKCSI